MTTEREARIEGAKRPRFQARIEGISRDKIGGGVWGGGSLSPPEIFCKIESEMVQSVWCILYIEIAWSSTLFNMPFRCCYTAATTAPPVPITAATAARPAFAAAAAGEIGRGLAFRLQ